MSKLSVFIDESGDFGRYNSQSPFYIVTLVFHDQSKQIHSNIEQLSASMKLSGMPNYTVHTGPIIRREKEYKEMPLLGRKRLFNLLFNFVRKVDITYHSIIIEKRFVSSDVDLTVKISKQLSSFLKVNNDRISSYDEIVIYYDNGQMELTHILVATFSSLLNNVQFRKVSPSDYKLFQAADMICTLELMLLKIKNKCLSASELKFFSSEKILKKSYLLPLQKKHFF